MTPWRNHQTELEHGEAHKFIPVLPSMSQERENEGMRASG